MNMNNDILKKCIVRLEYKSTTDIEKFEGSGSGAIVHLNKNKQERDCFYVFTAKHTFFKDNTNNEDMDESKINSNNISIFDFKNEKTDSKVVSIIGINKKYDFLILVVEKATYPLPEIPPLPIYEDDFKDCKICGFPSSKKPDKNTSILFDCTYSMRDDVHDTYEVKSNTLLTIDGENLNANTEISGLSGSGVFVESATGGLYLAGIQIQTASHNSLVCLDIRILAKEINEALEDKNYLPIEIDGYALKEELGIDTSKIDFTEMLDKLKDDELDKFKDKSHKELIEAFNGGIKQKLDEKSKELAKKYLYLSLLFHKEKDNRRSTIYFKKAVKNNPNYYALFLKAKDERNLTDKEKEKYNEISSKVSNSDISADDLFFEMLEDKLMKLEDFNEKEGVYMQIISLLESKFLDLKRKSEGTTEIKDKIISKSIELFNQYIKEKKFDDANSMLNKLKEYNHGIINEEYELYTDENFLTNISLSKLDLSNKYLELLEKHKADSKKFSELKSQLEKVYSDETDIVHNELKTVKQKIVNYEEKVENLVQIFTTYIADKEILNKVREVNSQLKKSHIKLDNISDTIKNNHNSLIQELQSDVIKTNRALVARVKKIYKNYKTNEEVKNILDTISEDMRKKIENILKNKKIYITEIEEIIKKCNYTLYKGIKNLYKENTNYIKDNFLKESLLIAKEKNKEYISTLKKSLKESREDVIDFKVKLKTLTQRLYEINQEYYSRRRKSIKIERKILKLKKDNVFLKNSLSENNNKYLIDIEKYKIEIKQLEKSVFKLEGKNEQIENLKRSISLSAETAKRLEWLKEQSKKSFSSSKKALIGLFLLGMVSFIGYLATGNSKDNHITLLKPKVTETKKPKSINQKEKEDLTSNIILSIKDKSIFKLSNIKKEFNTSDTLELSNTSINSTKPLKKKDAIPKSINQITIDTILEPLPKRIIIVKKGDTLSGLAKKFYGNPMMFNKIIKVNDNIKNASTPIHIGQQIYIPSS